MTNSSSRSIPKSPSGIKGFDDICNGGLPKGRTTLIAGEAGCGKTIFGMEFVIRGILQHNEPGVVISFEESIDELHENFRSLGYDLRDLIEKKKLIIDHIKLRKSEYYEAGEFSLEGLFIRLEESIKKIKAKRILIDTVDVIFGGIENQSLLRAEMNRLFDWLKEKRLTSVVTGEKGNAAITRTGLEEYVSDCVIILDHKIVERASIRTLRILKYRGSSHGTNEYPFLIDEDGIAIFPITSLSLNYKVSDKRISTGVKDLDQMFEGKGYYKGSTILISGSAGAGKTSLVARFAEAACERGERCFYYSFEEPQDQIVRNTSSIGIDLKKYIDSKKLRLMAQRPTILGLEQTLTKMFKDITDFSPDNVIIDPITNFTAIGSEDQVKSMMTRLIDYLKNLNITLLLTSLTSKEDIEETEIGISSLIDTWIYLNFHESSGERNKIFYILKSRGMAHSNQMREFVFTSNGIKLEDVYLGPGGGLLTGVARSVQEAKDQNDLMNRKYEIESKKREIDKKRRLLEKEIQSLRTEFDNEEEELNNLIAQEQLEQELLESQRRNRAHARHAKLERGMKKDIKKGKKN